MVINGSSILVVIDPCLVADRTNKVEQGSLITAYWVLMISHVAPGGQVRQTNHRWAGKGLLLVDSTFTWNNSAWWKLSQSFCVCVRLFIRPIFSKN